MPADDPAASSRHEVDAVDAGVGEIAFGAWVLRAESEALSVDALLERFGQLHRCPVATSPRTAQMAPGQPCLFVRTDRSRVVGLWAIGEVVAPALALPAGTPLLPAEVGLAPDLDERAERHYAEVELLPLAKPVALDELRADPALATSELVAHPDRPDPLVLTPAELRAIEAMEVWIEAPSDDQRAALDRLLVAEDDILDQL